MKETSQAWATAQERGRSDQVAVLLERRGLDDPCAHGSFLFGANVVIQVLFYLLPFPIRQIIRKECD